MKYVFLLLLVLACLPLLLRAQVPAQQEEAKPSARAWRPPGTELAPLRADPRCAAEMVLSHSGEKIRELVNTLGNLTATETLLHQHFRSSGKMHREESRTSEYLLAIHQPAPGTMYVDEYRRGLEPGVFSDGIATSGLLTLAFIFHPDRQDSYEMQCEGVAAWKGQPAWVVHFRQRRDRPRRQLAYKVGGETREVALQGRAWIDAASFHILHIEAEMMDPIPEIGLLSHLEMADYGPVPFRRKSLELWLPQVTHTYAMVRGKRLHIASSFRDYLLFEVETRHAENLPRQDP